MLLLWQALPEFRIFHRAEEKVADEAALFPEPLDGIFIRLHRPVKSGAVFGIVEDKPPFPVRAAKHTV